MDRRTLLPTGVAIVGALAVVIGIHMELLHMRAGVGRTIDTGWASSLNHEEGLLAGLSLLGIVGALAARRWRRAGLLSQAVGGVVLFYALRAVMQHILDPGVGIYTGLPVFEGTTGQIVFGAEPYLLVFGGLLLIAAGVLGYRGWPRSGDSDTITEKTSDHSLSEFTEA